MPDFAPTLAPPLSSFGARGKGDQAFSAFAPFAPSPERLWRIGDRVGANKVRKCHLGADLNSCYFLQTPGAPLQTAPKSYTICSGYLQISFPCLLF